LNVRHLVTDALFPSRNLGSVERAPLEAIFEHTERKIRSLKGKMAYNGRPGFCIQELKIMLKTRWS